jgi:tetratricopeptide (TPR) repeat protein
VMSSEAIGSERRLLRLPAPLSRHHKTGRRWSAWAVRSAHLPIRADGPVHLALWVAQHVLYYPWTHAILPLQVRSGARPLPSALRRLHTRVATRAGTQAGENPTMAQLRIFVSHSMTDAAFCTALVRALRMAGADVWYDEHNLGAGVLRHATMPEILGELAQRLVFLVVLSPAACASSWVQDACAWAHNFYRRDPNRILLAAVAAPLEHTHCDGLVHLEDFGRIEAPGGHPYAPAEAIERALRLLALVPEDAAAAAPAPTALGPGARVADLVVTGKALAAQQRYAEALLVFEHASKCDPDSFDAWVNLGMVRGQLQQGGESLIAYYRALMLRPGGAVAWNTKGTRLSEVGRVEEALAAFEQALALDPTFAAAWNNRGSALYGMRRYDEALAAFEQALALDSKLAAAWHNKGAALRHLKRVDQALTAFEQALLLDPTYAAAWNNKGYALYGMRRYDEALVAYERALAVDPTLATAWCNKGNALYALHRYPEALTAFEQALHLDPTYAAAWNNKGSALYTERRYEEALAAFEQALALDAAFPDAWVGKSMTLRALGRTEEAALAEDEAAALRAKAHRAGEYD